MYVIASMLGSPFVAAAMMAIGALVYLTLVVRDVVRPELAREVHGPLGPTLHAEVDPDDIAADDVRAAYVTALAAHEELRLALNRSRGIADELGDIYRRCGELVQASGRVARSSNTLHAYLVEQGPASLEMSANQLDRLAGATRDVQAALAFRRAASARRQHLELHHDIEGLFERVKARLAMVVAFLGMVHALVIKLDVLHFEQAHAVGTSISESLESLRIEMDTLGSSLEGALSS